ncbi:MAG TPA: hypothetical protein VL860_00940, partial [Planctomycetota bacterium]|nr:hypothetical protein [Planctomycetota bacterium]
MGVPMRMRCDNCGYDFVGQLQYSDQRQGDVIRCKACEYEVPMISDEEIAEVETTLNKERNLGIYAMIAWAVCFTAMVVWGLSYFWQVGMGLGSEKTKNKDEILWALESRTALYLRANLSGDEKVQIANSSILLNVAEDDPAAKIKLDEYNAKLKKMNTALEYIGDSVKTTVLPAITAKMDPYLGANAGGLPADWKKIE